MGQLVAGGMSIYGAITGHDNASAVKLPGQWDPGWGNLAAANTGALSGIQNLPGANLGQTTLPMAQQTAQNLYNNPYAGGFQQGAGVASGLGQQGALNQYGAGGALGNLGFSQIPYAQSLYNMGFDPQQALYNRAAGQTQQGTLANLSNAGLATSPYGQGVLGNTMGNFNIDWQNQQLGRALQGAQGAGGVLQNAAGLVGQGAGMQAGAPGQFLAASGMPYGAYGQIGQGQFGALQGLQGIGQGAQNLAQQQVQDYLSYLGYGTQQQLANTQTAGLGLKQAGMTWDQNRQLGQDLGAGIQGVGNSNFMKGIGALAMM